MQQLLISFFFAKNAQLLVFSFILSIFYSKRCTTINPTLHSIIFPLFFSRNISLDKFAVFLISITYFLFSCQRHIIRPHLFSLNQLDLLVPVLYPLLLILNRYNFSKILSLTFNDYTFQILFHVIVYIYDYPKSQACITFYIDVVKQTSTIFDIKWAFVEVLIKAIKKNKSQAYVE